MTLEFEFINDDGEVQDNLKFCTGMVAFFECLKCRTLLFFYKKYDPIPLHYQSLLRLSKPVTCPKCHSIHRHIRDDENEFDIVVLREHEVDPAQLSLFE